MALRGNPPTEGLGAALGRPSASVGLDEVVLVDARQAIGRCSGDTDVVVDHQLGRGWEAAP